MFETGHHSSTEPAEQHGANLLQESGQETTQVHTHTPAPKIASEPGHGGVRGVCCVRVWAVRLLLFSKQHRERARERCV